MRPVISSEILAGNGSWEKSEFLVDTGADRTGLSAATLAKLDLQPLPIQEGISGLGGMADSVIVETQLLLLVKMLARSYSEGSMLRLLHWKHSI